MLRVAAMLFFALNPSFAYAICEGDNLIDALPAQERKVLYDRADTMPYSTGILYRATRGNTEITWFGTYHFKHELTETHLELVKPLMADADQIYLEVSNADTKRMERAMADDPSIMFITEGPTLPELLGDQDWETYKDAMAERAIPGFMAAKFKPIWAAMMLGIGPCEARNGVLQGAGIDKLIGDHAEQIGKPSRSLEDFKTILTMLDSFPKDDQLDMIRLFFGWSDDADNMAYTLRELYLSQKIGLIWEYSRKTSLELGGETAEDDFAFFEQQFLTDRNRDWIDLLLEEAEGQKVFAAVGAAHLPGEVGVLFMLEQAGFEIERLPFEI